MGDGVLDLSPAWLFRLSNSVSISILTKPDVSFSRQSRLGSQSYESFYYFYYKVTIREPCKSECTSPLYLQENLGRVRFFSNYIFPLDSNFFSVTIVLVPALTLVPQGQVIAVAFYCTSICLAVGHPVSFHLSRELGLSILCPEHDNLTLVICASIENSGILYSIPFWFAF